MEQQEQRAHRRVSGFLALPTTRIGKSSGYLLLLGVILVVLNSAIVMPATEGRAGLQAAQTVANAVVGLCVMAAGVCGLAAVLRKGERSWVLFLSISVFALVAVMMVQDLVTPGQ